MELERQELLFALAPWATVNSQQGRTRPVPLSDFLFLSKPAAPATPADRDQGWREITRMLDQMYDQQQAQKPDG